MEFSYKRTEDGESSVGIPLGIEPLRCCRNIVFYKYGKPLVRVIDSSGMTLRHTIRVVPRV